MSRRKGIRTADLGGAPPVPVADAVGEGRPFVKHAVAGRYYVRQYHLAKVGDGNLGHSHTHDHVTLLLQGKIRVYAGGAEFQELEASPDDLVVLNVPAGVMHQFVAMADDTVYCCVHRLLTEAGEDASPEALRAQPGRFIDLLCLRPDRA